MVLFGDGVALGETPVPGGPIMFDGLRGVAGVPGVLLGVVGASLGAPGIGKVGFTSAVE